MQREPAAFLWDVHESALRIREFVVGNDFESFAASVLLQSIVWKVVHQHLPALEKTVQYLLDAEPPPNTTSQGKS
jgi:uncharacterized protein with HEPN domain